MYKKKLRRQKTWDRVNGIISLVLLAVAFWMIGQYIIQHK